MATYWLLLTDAVDPDWWEPLAKYAASVQGRGLPMVDPDDFVYVARVDRPGLPMLHVYRHLHTRKCLNVDEAGAVWRFVGKGRGSEGYEQMVDPAEALARAEVERGNHLATHTRAKCEDAWLTRALRAEAVASTSSAPAEVAV